jgi:hypothetical protein
MIYERRGILVQKARWLLSQLSAQRRLRTHTVYHHYRHPCSVTPQHSHIISYRLVCPCKASLPQDPEGQLPLLGRSCLIACLPRALDLASVTCAPPFPGTSWRSKQIKPTSERVSTSTLPHQQLTTTTIGGHKSEGM